MKFVGHVQYIQFVHFQSCLSYVWHLCMCSFLDSICRFLSSRSSRAVCDRLFSPRCEDHVISVMDAYIHLGMVSACVCTSLDFMLFIDSCKINDYVGQQSCAYLQ